MLQSGTDTEKRTEAVEPPASLETFGGLVGERGPVQHTGVVDQCGQRPEFVHDLANRRIPLLLGGDVEMYGDDVVEAADGRLELVGAHIACGYPEAVRVQPPDDRRALSAGRAGHQRHPVRHCASFKCSAAPRRSACDSDARVIMRKPNSAIAFPGLPALAWMAG